MQLTNITRLSIFSRLFVIFLQCISNHLIEDHDAGVFKSPIDPNQRQGKCDFIVEFLLGGLRRWDAEYFLHISIFGYTFENTLAFFPLYPLCIRMIRYVLVNVIPFMSVRTLSLLIGVTINIFFFAKAANALYELGKKVLRDQRKAELATVLFCFNPASIFFTAPYSESLFSYLSFSLMLKCIQDINSVLIVVPLSLSILCRSNGLINIGFFVYYGFKKMFSQNTVLSFVTILLKIISILISICFHYGLMQVYNYYLFCSQKNFHFPEFLKEFAISNGYVMAGNKSDDTSPWCSFQLPMSYSYVQEHYWNVGYLNYYEVKQIPNFLLAFPIVFIILYNSFKYFVNNKSYCYRLGIFNLSPQVLRRISIADQNLFVFVVHAVALTIFSLLFAHVQVTTRLISSSNPTIYWFCANAFLNVLQSKKKNDDATRDEIVLNIFDIKRYKNISQKLIMYFFLGYYALGTILFSNFLPWT